MGGEWLRESGVLAGLGDASLTSEGEGYVPSTVDEFVDGWEVAVARALARLASNAHGRTGRGGNATKAHSCPSQTSQEEVERDEGIVDCRRHRVERGKV